MDCFAVLVGFITRVSTVDECLGCVEVWYPGGMLGLMVGNSNCCCWKKSVGVANIGFHSEPLRWFNNNVMGKRLSDVPV